MCLSLPRCERMRTYLSWFKSYSPRPKGEEDPPFPHELDRTGNPEGWPLFWHLLGSRRSWMKRSNGQGETGFIYPVHLQWSLPISDFWGLYSLFKWTLKFLWLKVGASANTWPQLYYLFPPPAQHCILAYNKRKKTFQNVCSKMHILVAATVAEAQGALTGLHSAKEVCHISHRSTVVEF